MSPSRKVGIAGIVGGGISLLAGVLAVFLPVLFAFRFLSADLGSRRQQMLSASIKSLLVGAPVGAFLGLFGILLIVVSIPIYIDAKRKEARLI